MTLLISTGQRVRAMKPWVVEQNMRDEIMQAICVSARQHRSFVERYMHMCMQVHMYRKAHILFACMGSGYLYMYI